MNGHLIRILATIAAAATAAALTTMLWFGGILIVQGLAAPQGLSLTLLAAGVFFVLFASLVGLVLGFLGASILLGTAFALTERLPLGWSHRTASVCGGVLAGGGYVLAAYLPDLNLVYSSRHILGVWMLRQALDQAPNIVIAICAAPLAAGAVAGLVYNAMAPAEGRGPFRPILPRRWRRGADAPRVPQS